MLVRRSLSLMKKVSTRVRSVTKMFYLHWAFPEISISTSATLDKGVRLSATDGGAIEIDGNVYLGPYVQIIARGGRIIIGDDVHVGTGCILVSRKCITIGRDSLIAEYVVIRDQDHEYSKRPIRKSGFQIEPITIGQDCWLGCKSTVLRGSNMGNGSVVGAHSLVRGDIPSYTLSVGCPAKVIKKLATE